MHRRSTVQHDVHHGQVDDVEVLPHQQEGHLRVSPRQGRRIWVRLLMTSYTKPTQTV